MDYGQPASYLTLQPGTDVVASDGQLLGKVAHVLAAEEEDIFDGLVIDMKAGPGGHRFVDSEQVDEIYEDAVVLKIGATEADQLPEPQPAAAAMDSEADPPGPLERKLRRAWDLISGNY